MIAIQPEHRVQNRLDPGSLRSLDDATKSTVADALSDWLTMGGPAVDHRLTPWSRAADRVRTPSDATAALTSARVLANDTLPSAATRLEQTLATSGLRRPASVAAWADTLALLQQVADITERVEPIIWSLDLQELVTNLAPAAGGIMSRSIATVFKPRYRAANKQVRSCRRVPLKSADLHALVQAASAARVLWQLNSVDGGPPRLPGDLTGTAGAYQRLLAELAALGAFVGASGLIDTDPTETGRSLLALLDDQTTLFKLPRLHELASTVDAAGFAAVRALVTAHDLDANAARDIIEHVWCASVLEQISLADVEVGAFDGATHTKHVREYADADRKQIAVGAAKVRRAVAEHVIDVRDLNKQGDALIGAEVRKNSRHRTLRELTQMAPDILLALKPCWAMSPLAVSQLLDAKPIFDVVVFDEASQVPPADAIPALMRAKQAIVAGDAKQLPPTTFFASATIDDDTDGIENNLTTGAESILDAMANVITAGSTTLKWHYRSRDERLIAFSNAQPSLYDWQMVTFPGAAGEDAIRHVHVPWRPNNGTDDESSSDEVRRIVGLVTEHAYTRPELSLGVIAMGIKHADRINEALRRARVDNPDLDDYFTSHDREPVFVKNLERVQGDERDAVILSIGYGKNADGRMLYRFGPINAAGGERRLNVAITRARSKMTVVSSFLPSDLDPNKLTSEGARMLGRYLAYAASNGTDLGPVQRPHPPLNAFEADVRDRLTAAGISLVAQLGASGYFIDFAACHPERPGEFVLAIEADGASYHSSATARERDRLRQDHLERLGWRFHRIWSTDWFRNRESEIARAVAAWESACALATQAQAKPPPAAMTWSPPVAGDSKPLVPVPTRQGMRPAIHFGQSIEDYADGEITAIVTWVASDGLLRTKAELLDDVITEMGYKRRGSRIAERIGNAIASLET